MERRCSCKILMTINMSTPTSLRKQGADDFHFAICIETVTDGRARSLDSTFASLRTDATLCLEYSFGEYLLERGYTGRVDDFSYFDCSSPFTSLLVEFHCTFYKWYKILLYYVYYYCILIK